MDHDREGSSYGRFFAMIATSTIAMFGLMYLNTYALEHVYFSQTRMWMALYWGPLWPSSCWPSCWECIATRC